jgi:hypothetical protein
MSRSPQIEKVVDGLVRVAVAAGLPILSIEVYKFEKITLITGEGPAAAKLEVDLDRELADFVQARNGQG